MRKTIVKSIFAIGSVFPMTNWDRLWSVHRFVVNRSLFLRMNMQPSEIHRNLDLEFHCSYF